MPRSKAEVRWAFAHKGDKGKDGSYAREVVEKVHERGTTSDLPEHSSKQGKARKAALREKRHG